MAYSLRHEQAAQEKLAQIWRASSRREKLAIADRFGYGGSDASKLRVMRRLLTGSLKEGQYAVVTDYFKPFVTQEDPNAWLGRVPPYSITQSYMLVSQVMYAAIDKGGLLTWEAYLNAPSKKDSLVALFKLYNETVLEKLKQSPQVSGRIEGIAFSKKGANALVDYLERGSGERIDLTSVRIISQSDFSMSDTNWRMRIIKIPSGVHGVLGGIYLQNDAANNTDSVVIPRADYGIALVPTKHTYKDGKRQSLTSQTFQRSFPKSKRDDMIRYANRSYGQMTRKGGRLA